MHAAPEIRDVFGDFDDDEEEDIGYAVQQDIRQDSNVSVWWKGSGFRLLDGGVVCGCKNYLVEQ